LVPHCGQTTSNGRPQRPQNAALDILKYSHARHCRGSVETLLSRFTAEALSIQQNQEAESCTRAENWNGSWETPEESDSGKVEQCGAAIASFLSQHSLASISLKNEYPVIVRVGNQTLSG